MNKSSEKRNINWILILCAGLLLVLAVVLIILFLIQGETTYTASSGDVEVTQSVTCKSSELAYPFLPSNGENSHELEVSVVISKDKLESAYLTYKQSFGTNERAERASDTNSVAIAKAFAEDNIGYESLGKKISTLTKASQLSLYANRNELNAITAKYFLLDGLAGSYSVNSITKAYNGKGLDCVISK